MSAFRADAVRTPEDNSIALTLATQKSSSLDSFGPGIQHEGGTTDRLSDFAALSMITSRTWSTRPASSLASARTKPSAGGIRRENISQIREWLSC